MASGKLHSEIYEVTEAVANQLNQAKLAGKRIIAVGTTSTRVLESLSGIEHGVGVLKAGTGQTELFIQPGTRFKFVDAMITNFHLPKSSLLMLISAFTTEPNAPHSFTDFASTPVGAAYTAAIDEKYHFFSFGDAMFIQ
jgi:S-adenosylmethionine:tRNA ribosyltransferase-isomerase